MIHSGNEPGIISDISDYNYYSDKDNSGYARLRLLFWYDVRNNWGHSGLLHLYSGKLTRINPKILDYNYYSGKQTEYSEHIGALKIISLLTFLNYLDPINFWSTYSSSEFNN